MLPLLHRLVAWLLAVLIIAAAAPPAAAQCPLIDLSRTITLSADAVEKPVVKTALGLLATDIGLVTNHTQQVAVSINRGAQASGVNVLAGVLTTPAIVAAVSANTVATADIAGQWEAFRIVCVANTNASFVLVVGSDARGVAYGILELSRMIGVGPWSWWADVVPDAIGQSSFTLPRGYNTSAKPSVQYRGVFLNDEDWGLRTWSSQTFEPGASVSSGQIGPNTYSRIFELLLRLRANTIWPAMHSGTLPFYATNGTRQAADTYGIVVGTSHAEPMLTNPAAEWNSTLRGSYNWFTNKAGVVQFWKERLELVRSTGSSDVLITMGMRGQGDSPLAGVSAGSAAAVAALADIIATQRQLLAQYYPVTQPQQIFVPYKEVLNVYDGGLKVPDNVTLVWCDDNFSYMTRLSNSTEQARSGGGGAYFHVSYWGQPHDYLWLASTHPSLIYYQMRRALQFNTKKFWIVNVGDIKPAEYLSELYLDLAWNVSSITPTTISAHLQSWAAREFGTALAQRIAGVMSSYYTLAASRKPEHMGWSQTETTTGNTPVNDTDFNPFAFGDEISVRLDAYSALQAAVSGIKSSVPTAKADAFYQLVEYPVTSAAQMNKKLLYAQKARLLAGYAISAANDYAALSSAAYDAIAAATAWYNTNMAGGKWNRMMTAKPRSLPVFGAPTLPTPVATSPKTILWAEYDTAPLANGTRIAPPIFIREANRDFFISIFTNNTSAVAWSTDTAFSWLSIVLYDTDVATEKKLRFSVAWGVVTKDINASCVLTVNGGKYPMVFTVKSFAALAPVATTRGYQVNTHVALDAANYTNAVGAGIQIMPGLGHSGAAVILPATTTGTYLEYNIYTTTTGPANITTYVLPNQPLAKTLRFSIAVDGGTPAVLSLATGYRSEDWKQWVLRGQTPLTTAWTFAAAGVHKIRVVALDEGVVVDQIMVDFKVGRRFYLVPTRKPVLASVATMATTTSTTSTLGKRGVRGVGVLPEYAAVGN
ncbi:hypothetical protein HDU90_003299 [Geranomyces variabilis]|nr:hypothetical protein HDU90_003299 [Geranomyces variabilis]